MMTSRKETGTCPFCGKTREVEYWQDDGIDYEGHARGHADSGYVDKGCDCPFGKLLQEKVQIKPMCRNCRYQASGYCRNKEVLSGISSMFDVGEQAAILNLSSVCPRYETNSALFKPFWGRGKG